MNRKLHFLVVEPYYGGSHQIFLEGLRDRIDFDWTFLTLPARKWKMRMQLAAPWIAGEIASQVAGGARYDGILVSTFVDLAVLRSMLLQKGIFLPVALYLHENQFAYPARSHDKTKLQFAAINFTSALSADSLAFNSSYNRDSFFSGIKKYVRKAADFSLSSVLYELEEKSHVLHPGLDFSQIDRMRGRRHQADIPVLLWNHRWEHDKNPESFFRVLFELDEEGVDFQLIVVGQSYHEQPEIFSAAWDQLAHRIIHFGYVPSRVEYIALLSQASIIISTAIHEFFGLSVVEAVRAGCYPLLPDRLAYRELYPAPYRYKHGQLKKRLQGLIAANQHISEAEIYSLTDRFGWEKAGTGFHDWLQALIR